MDSSTYSVLLNKIKKSNPIPHHNFPSHNLLSVENLLEVSVGLNENIPEDETRFLGTVPCYQKYPYAISKSCPYFCGSGVADDARGLVQKKSKWQKDLTNLELHDVSKAIKQIEDLRQNKPVKVSRNLKKLVQHIGNDPEPMFFGNHNWLYSGGALSYVETTHGAILIGADIIDNKPGFNVLKLSENLDEIECKSSGALKASPVLQITSKWKQSTLIVCLRQKNHLTLFDLSRPDSPSPPLKLWRKKATPPKLLTCADISPSCEEVLVSDTNRDLHVFHLERKRKVYAGVGRRMSPHSGKDPWSQVAFGDLGLYVAFRNCFVVVDPRDVSSRAAFEYSPSRVLNSCEHICAFACSPSDPNYLYLTTTHSLLQLDLRTGGTLHKWTHLMKSPPQFVATAKDGHPKDILLLHSQDVGEAVGIVNEAVQRGGEGTGFVSRSLPCLVSGVKESLGVARRRGVCLSPFLAERLNFAVTGVQCVKSKAGHINIFTSNSAGDIFVSKLQKREAIPVEREEEERQTVESMKVYESHMKSFPLKDSLDPHLEVIDMSHVLKDLSHSKRSPKKHKRKAEFTWKYHEMYSPENLEFYRDYIAEKVLRVWGHRQPEEDVAEPGMSVDEKVLQWLWENR